MCLREKIVHRKLGVKIRHLSDSQGHTIVSEPEKTKHPHQFGGEKHRDMDDDHFSVIPDSEKNMKKFRVIMGQGQEIEDDKECLVPAQDVHFFYTRSHLSALQNCSLIFSTNFQFIFILKKCITQFSYWIVLCTIFPK